MSKKTEPKHTHTDTDMFEQLECFEPGEVDAVDSYRLSLVIERGLKGLGIETDYRVADAASVSMFVTSPELGEFKISVKRDPNFGAYSVR